MLEMKLRAVDRVFARHPKPYMLCEGCLIHEAEVREIWATPIYALSGAQVEWIVSQTGHFDNDAIRYYWPAILAHLVREPVYGEWWEALFTRLYSYGPQFTGAERQAVEAVLIDLLAEPVVQPVEQAIIAAFLAFWIEDVALVAELMTDSIQQTWSEILAEPVLFGEPGELERLWNLAQLRQTPRGLREVSLERCMLLEGLLDGLRCALV
ncbi:MAG TPA: hypothetical protein VFU32_14075 [Ktedonobacterales bacterium]|nr:hypothetical protein [Ktedonobacterales bacterium]